MARKLPRTACRADNKKSKSFGYEGNYSVHCLHEELSVNAHMCMSPANVWLGVSQPPLHVSVLHFFGRPQPLFPLVTLPSSTSTAMRSGGGVEANSDSRGRLLEGRLILPDCLLGPHRTGDGPLDDLYEYVNQVRWRRAE